MLAKAWFILLTVSMPANIEIKAALKDRAAAITVAEHLGAIGPETFAQEDVFFKTGRGRLKLRIFAPDRGELIRYERPDTAEARCSRYTIAGTSDPYKLLDILSETLERDSTVRKIRTLYLVGQTRIHFDQVEGLGDFMELEVVLREGQAEEDGKRIATALLEKFGIENDQLIAEAYVDLLAASSALVSSRERPAG